MTDALEGRQLTYGVGGRLLLEDVSLRVAAGEIHAVLGPNGAGKSTLLRVLCGEIQADQGSVTLAGTPLHGWPTTVRARRLGVLPQLDSLRFGFTVAQVVTLGRLPWGGVDSALDSAAAVARAMSRANIGALAGRRYPDLSGGERARVQFARVCAQVDAGGAVDASTGCAFLLLDEPVARLDPAHQHRLLGELRNLAAEGVGVLVTLHEPNHALRYADRCSLLADGRVHASGPTAEVLTAEQLRRLYGVGFCMVENARGDRWIAVT